MTPLEAAINHHLEHLRVHGYSPRTVHTRGLILNRFSSWAVSLGISEPRQISRRILLSYQRQLFRRKSKSGRPISFRTQKRSLSDIKQFFSWLTKHDHIDANPAADIEFPKLPRSLPRDVLTFEEVEMVMAQPDVKTEQGLRDRTILEVLYATGLRRAEVANLALRDLDFSRLRLFVHEGKGKRDRVVPMSTRAFAWLEKYIDDVRTPSLDDDGTVFLTLWGKPLGLQRFSLIAKKHLRSAGIDHGACHVFRHTMATLMLENGADVRFVQEMLGHADLTTTQIYTRVSIRKLQDVYNATHPVQKPENSC